jgi:microcompartment protein CcmK/EutM
MLVLFTQLLLVAVAEDDGQVTVAEEAAVDSNAIGFQPLILLLLEQVE